jgi:hypothetical protein
MSVASNLLYLNTPSPNTQTKKQKNCPRSKEKESKVDYEATNQKMTK